MKKPVTMSREPRPASAAASPHHTGQETDTAPTLTLSIQYGVEAQDLPRWRLRRWVRRAVDAVAQARREAALQAGSTASADDQPLRHVTLGLRLVDDAEGRELNRDFRRKDYATNVLTFEYGLDPDGNAGGDIVLCIPVLYREAAEQNKPLLAHATHLVIHGVLHALGYDHIDEDDAQEMESLEIAILTDMGLPDPYVSQPAHA